MQPSCNRSSPSCLQTRTSSSSTASTFLHHHHHQQPQSFYGPLTLQPYTAVLHPSCVYPPQRNTGPPSPALLAPQGNQVNEWQVKNKPQALNVRNQRQLFYSTKPSFPFEQPQISPPLPSAPSSYLLTTSNFCHGPYSTDHYNSGVAVISQPYFKPPEVQALCLVQDRQFISQQQTHQYNPYYNLSSTLQTVTANTNLQLPSQMASYSPFANNQLSLQTNQIFSNSPQNPIFNPLKSNRLSSMELPAIKYPKNKVHPCAKTSVATCRKDEEEETEKAPNPLSNYKDFCAEVQNNQANSSSKTQEERLSDDSSGSFDFTVEAEKMVSALCNTSSNDLEKFDNSRNESLLSGAGDNAPIKKNWLPNFSTDSAAVDVSGISVATQTQEDDAEKYPEAIRKTTVWGCNEAENVLNSGKSHRTSKLEWLMNLSVATRTAITKSSTCFSIFAGDRVLIQDLINSLLRISNGWLILDNYLNKQQSPSLADKYDGNLIKSFQIWEGATHELLRNVVKTFLLLEEKSEQEEQIETSGTPGTFPGDVSIYTTCDLLEPPVKFNLAPGTAVISPSQNFLFFRDHKKETKLKGKWTITESISCENWKNSSHSKNESNKLDESLTSRFRSKANSTIKSTSLNAEFVDLKNKVLDKQSSFKDKKQSFNKTCPKGGSVDQVFRFQLGIENQDASASSQMPRIDPMFSSSGKMDPIYMNTKSFNSKTFADIQDTERKKNFDPNCDTMSSNNVFGGSPKDQVEFGPVPINKMTLLSQIEPSTSTANKEEMTDNLSAWFASMRNVSSVSNSEAKFANFSGNSPQEITRDKMDLTRQLQLDTNRQLLSLQNMQSIQSAPWNAANLINNRSVQQTHDEYDSSEDVRIYMKPGSYNVPKKRHQKRCNRKSNNTTSRSGIRHSNKDRSDSSFPISKIDETASLGPKFNFPISGTFFKNPSDAVLKDDCPSEDVTWKAACASAEVLLETMNFHDSFNSQMDQQRKSKEQQQFDGQVLEQQSQIEGEEMMFEAKSLILRDEDELPGEKDHLPRDKYQIFFNKDQMFKDNEMFWDNDRMFKETDQMFKESDLMFKENDPMFKENDPMFKENDLIKKNDRIFKENNSMFKENDLMFKENHLLFKDNDPMFKENDSMFKENDPIFKDHDPIFKDHDPIFKDHDPIFKDNDPIFKDNDPIFKDHGRIVRYQDQMRESDQKMRAKLNRNQVQTTRNLDQMMRDQLTRNQDLMIRYQDQKTRNQEIRKHDSMIRNQDQIITNQDLILRNYEQMINKKGQKLNIQYHTINKQDQMIKLQDPMIKNQDQMTRNRDQINKEQDQINKEQDQINKEQNQIITEQIIKHQMFSDQEGNTKDELIRNRNQKISKPRNRDQVLNYHGHKIKNRIIRYQEANPSDQDPKIRHQIFRTQDQILKNQDEMKEKMLKNQDEMKEKMLKNQDEMKEKMLKNQDEMKEKMLKNQDEMKEQMLRSQDQMIRSQNQIIRNQNQKQCRSKSKKHRDDKDCDASSYEASEDDSEPSSKTSRGLKRSGDIKIGKTNVKTDSWLIRTLNNASKGQIQDEDNDLASSDSLNSSIHEDEQNERIKVASKSPTISGTKLSKSKDFFPNFAISNELPGENVGKATYSETVRRSASNFGKKEPFKKAKTAGNESIVTGAIFPFSGKKVHKKGVEKSYLAQKSRKAAGKRFFKDVEGEAQGEEKIKIKFSGEETSFGMKPTLGKGHGRRKDTNLVADGKHKSSDRGWSVWYSSRRKQTLSPLALSKLEAIHRAVWKMDEACVFKYPPSTGPDDSPNKMIDDYCKIVKNPMFLETIGHKLKNRVYLKVEHAVRDFRRIVCNSRLYHKNDSEFSAKIDTLSKKLEELFEEHFANLDFENVSSAGDTSPVYQRFKLQSQRNRSNANKKSVTGPDKTENTNEHLN